MGMYGTQLFTCMACCVLTYNEISELLQPHLDVYMYMSNTRLLEYRFCIVYQLAQLVSSIFYCCML
jgi:hypothetical protein